MIQLNLLPEIKREYLRARRMQARVISLAILASIIAGGLVALMVFYVYAVQGIYSATLSGSIKEKADKLAAVKDIDKYATVQNQLASLSELHNKKIAVARLFDIMTQLNPQAPNNVRISALDFDHATTTITMDGTTDTFTGLETFRDTLKNAELTYMTAGTAEAVKEPLFTPGSVTIVSQGLGQVADGGKKVVSFKFSMLYNPKTFARDANSVSVLVPQKDTTQSRQDTPGVFDGSEQIQEEEQR